MLPHRWYIIKLLFPFKNPMNSNTLAFGGIVTNIWIWFLHTFASIISTLSHRSHICLNIFPIAALYFSYIICLRYFGANTIWYWHRLFVCAKLSMSFIRSPVLLLLRLPVVSIVLQEFILVHSSKLFIHSLSEWAIVDNTMIKNKKF